VERLDRQRLAAKAKGKRSHPERRLGEIDREIGRLVDAIAKGLGDPVVLGPKSTALCNERKTIRAELEGFRHQPSRSLSTQPFWPVTNSSWNVCKSRLHPALKRETGRPRRQCATGSKA